MVVVILAEAGMSEWLLAIRRWHWAAVGLITGLVVGFARDAMQPVTADDRLLDRYDVILTDAREFEAALTDRVGGEHHRFEDLVVYPARSRARDGSRRYFVTGQYWDGRQKPGSDGTARYAFACFVTSGPYVTSTTTPSKSYPSVLAYLEDLRSGGQTEFRNAWWQPLLTDGRLLWPLGTTILLGVVWPTVVNLHAFGTLGRPRESKGISLWSIRRGPARPHSTPPEAPRTAATGHDASGDSALAEVPAAPPASPLTVVHLKQEVALAAAPATPRPQQEYGAEEEDFYPTELHPRRGESKH